MAGAHSPRASTGSRNSGSPWPLMAAAGAALDDPGTCVYHDNNVFCHVTVSSFRFGRADDSGAAFATA